MSTERSVYRAADAGSTGARQGARGINVPATLAGTLAALGTLILLGGLVSAIVGAIGYQAGLKGNQEELSIGSLIAGLVTLFIAFVIGGWVAARIARFAGGLHGLMTAVWMIVLAAILAALGAWVGAEYNVFGNLSLPQWFSSDAVTTGAIVSGLVAIGAMLLGGWLGGRWGEHHRHARDVELVETRERVDVRAGGIVGRRREGG